MLRLVTAQAEAPEIEQKLMDAALVLAPFLMFTEVANVLWKLSRASALPARVDPQELLWSAAELVDHLEPDRHL